MIACAVSLLACKSRKQSEPVATPEGEPAAPALAEPSRGEPVGEQPLDEFLQHRICDAHKPPCRFLRAFTAGKNARQEALWVAEIDVDDRPPVAPGDDEYSGGLAGREHEYWVAAVVEQDGQQYLSSLTHVLRGHVVDDVENDVGERETGTMVEFGANRLTVTTSHWDRLGEERRDKDEYQLSPLWLLEDTYVSYTDSSGRDEGSFDLRMLEGFYRTSSVVCAAEQGGDDSDDDYGDSYEEAPEFVEYEYLSLPNVRLPEAYKRGAWRDVAIDSCGVTLEGGSAGFIIHGTPTGAADGAMDGELRAILDDRLYVEVEDDHWITTDQANAWYLADHLEIWLLADTTDFYECYADGKRSKNLLQWGVTVGSGKVVPAYGKPGQPLVVEHRPPGKGQPARFAITLPEDVNTSHITLVYSDSDDGKRQEYLLATSEFRFGHAQFLGATYDTGGVRCRISDEKMLVVDEVLPTADTITP